MKEFYKGNHCTIIIGYQDFVTKIFQKTKTPAWKSLKAEVNSIHYYLQQIENSMNNVDNSKYGQSAPKLIEVKLHLIYLPCCAHSKNRLLKWGEIFSKGAFLFHANLRYIFLLIIIHFFVDISWKSSFDELDAPSKLFLSMLGASYWVLTWVLNFTSSSSGARLSYAILISS